jgi:hypothetical protein
LISSIYPYIEAIEDKEEEAFVILPCDLHASQIYISYMLKEFPVLFEMLVGWAIHIPINTKVVSKIC